MELKDDTDGTLDIPCSPCSVAKCRADGKIGVHPMGCDDDPELEEDVMLEAGCEVGEREKRVMGATRDVQ